MPERRSVSPGWRSVGMCWDGDQFDLEGINPWEHEWILQKEQIVIAHPSYLDQRHDANVWVIRTGDRVVRFAAGEMSPLAWAFFLPSTDSGSACPCIGMTEWNAAKSDVWASHQPR